MLKFEKKKSVAKRLMEIEGQFFLSSAEIHTCRIVKRKVCVVYVPGKLTLNRGEFFVQGVHLFR